MKRQILKSSLFVGVATLLFAFPNFRKGELKDIAKPHLGIYECRQAQIDAQEYLDRFSYIRLELKEKGKYELTYCEKNGNEKKITGKYKYNGKQEKLTLYLDSAGVVKKEFPLKKGVLTCTISLGEKTLHLQFEQK